ncbi:MAG: ABC transporter ATP-binding protein [Chloroflexota bacterium]
MSIVSLTLQPEAASAPTGNVIVRARGLTKRFGTFEAVKGIDFDVLRQECFGFLGPNGAGKTSTLKMIYCASPVTAGELLVNGIDVMRYARRVKALLGVAAQNDNLDPDLTVVENLRVHARYFDIPPRVAAARATELLELFQLAAKASSRVRELSGGMKRRLVIARALVNEPGILLLDEPTTGLDPQARHLVWQKVNALKQAGTTLLLTTHYMDEAARLCDRLVIMNHGHILAQGTPAELTLRFAGREVLELRAGAAERDLLRQRLASGGLSARSADVEDALFVFSSDAAQIRLQLGVERNFVQRPSTLEDVFLTLTGSGLGFEEDSE